MIPALIDHLWQSTLFALAAGLLTLTLRRNGAGVRYGLWFAASLKFLIPFAVLAAAGGATVERLHLPLAAPAGLRVLGPVVEPMTAVPPLTPFAAIPEAAAPAAAAPFDPAPLLLAVWALGLAAVLLVWAARWSRIRAALRAATPTRLPAPVPVLATAAPMEPCVVGLRRPVLIVPDGMAEQLSPAEWKALLAHELCHIRRRDNLTGAVHMLVQALFWFHPLVWWLGARLVAEREQACDEAVVRGGADVRAYAQGILKVCRLHLQRPLACAAGASGGDLKRRVQRILAGRTGARLGLPKTMMLAGAAVLSVAAPVSAGVLASAPMPARTDVAGVVLDLPEPVAASRAPEALRAAPAPVAPAQRAPAASPPARPAAAPRAAEPIVLASFDAASPPAPEIPAAETARVAADLSQATPALPVIPAAASQAPRPPMEDRMPKLVPALFTAALLTAGAAVAAPPVVHVSPDAPRPRFGGEFGLTESGPVAGYWRSECYSWHIRAQARRAGPAPGLELEAALRRFVSGLIVERPNYDDMSPAMAQSVRKNLVTYWPSINHMGHASSARKFDTTKDGDVLYVLNQAGGRTHWNVTVDPNGKIASAFLCIGTGL